MRGSSIIYLVGFMGSGKTSVGLRLAERLGWVFVDVDREIERGAGESISDIFRNSGESRFRALETDELRRVSRGERKVVALGGGAFCSEGNRRIVKSTGASIWLDVPMDVIFARCGGDLSRPLFSGRREMERLLELRRPHYTLADIHVEAGELAVDDVVERILQSLRASGFRA